MPTGVPTLTCRACGASDELASLAWRCPCGGLFDLTVPRPAEFPLEAIARRPATMWRYREALPLPVGDGWRAVTMGEGCTPIVPIGSDRAGVLAKVEYASPTLSFKDRGAVVLVALASELGAERLVADSSGNAGTAVAAYAARARLPCAVFVPAATSPKKRAQIEAHGAQVHLVPGTREDTAAAAMEAADEPGTFYASHVYHPGFHHGTKTYAFEVWEQLGGRVPDALVLPAGNGTLVLGAALGFAELVAAGVAGGVPRIVAVQAAACAPIAAADAAGADHVGAVTGGETAAEGIAVAAPARGDQILAAVRATGGRVVTVDEDAIAGARAWLAGRGFWVEPTAAAPWAAVLGQPDLVGVPGGSDGPGDPEPAVVVPLCGAGLKAGAPPALR